MELCIFKVTQSQPDESGIRMHEELKKNGFESTLILDSCAGFVFLSLYVLYNENFSYIMERMDMVIVGAEGVMETGGIINKVNNFHDFVFIYLSSCYIHI